MKQVHEVFMKTLLHRLGNRARSVGRALFPSDPLANCLSHLVAHGLNLRVIYDIGAHQGSFATGLNRYFPGVDFFLFEENKAMESSLRSTGFQYHIATLSSQSGNIQFYQRGGTGDSYYKEATSAYDAVEPIVQQ